MLIEHYFSQLLAFSSTPHCQSLLQRQHLTAADLLLPAPAGSGRMVFPMILPCPAVFRQLSSGSRDIGGVSRSDAQTLASLSLTEEQLSSPSGLQSMIYHYRDTGILAFAGSNDMSDMMTNIRRGADYRPGSIRRRCRWRHICCRSLFARGCLSGILSAAGWLHSVPWCCSSRR